jgi:hypothetical protein
MCGPECVAPVQRPGEERPPTRLRLGGQGGMWRAAGTTLSRDRAQQRSPTQHGVGSFSKTWVGLTPEGNAHPPIWLPVGYPLGLSDQICDSWVLVLGTGLGAPKTERK